MGASVPGENKGVQNVGSGIRGPGSVSRLCYPRSMWLSASPSDPVPWFSHLQNGTALIASSEADDRDDQRQGLDTSPAFCLLFPLSSPLWSSPWEVNIQ